jgi:predicted RNase H-like nuclease
VNFVGVDLAWGDRNPSGLAVIDATGVLTAVATAVTTEDIVDRLEAWTRPAGLVAFDAPLVVANPSGARPCERLVNRYFGRFHAGCYPSNLGQPAFADGGRAHRLAGLLGLDVDPESTMDRRAIEVYPHPAIVMLFGLEAILRYKNRACRTQPSQRDELLKLMSFVDSQPVVDIAGSDQWQTIRATVEQATTKAALKRAEDRIDAVVCAYIAWYAQIRPDDVRTRGDDRNGYIVTPVDPALAQLIDADRAVG